MKWTKFQRKACVGKTPFWIKDNWAKKRRAIQVVQKAKERTRCLSI